MDIASIPWDAISFKPPRLSRKPSARIKRRRERFNRLIKTHGIAKARKIINRKPFTLPKAVADGTFAFIDSKPMHDPTGWFLVGFWRHKNTLDYWTKLPKQLSYIHTPIIGRNGKEYSLKELKDIYKKRLTENVRFRRIMRRFVHLLRCRIIRKKIVGTEDLYTLAPIPDRCAVHVIDFASRKLYIFHTTTILKSIMSSLYYTNYGIAQPLKPKNPYTNLPWTYGQLLSITQQIIINLIRNQRLPPSDFIAFCDANYDPCVFYTNNALDLAKRAANQYFTGDPEMAYNYTDMVNAIYDHYLMYSEHRMALRAYVRNQRLPSELQTEWTALLVQFFMYENMNVMDIYETFDDMMNDLSDLHRRSVSWWMTSPRQILRRVVPAAPAAPDSDSESEGEEDETDAAIGVNLGRVSPFIPVVDSDEQNTLP